MIPEELKPKLQERTESESRKKNHFWWGAVVGVEYGEVSTWRCSKKEEPHKDSKTFVPYSRVKYGSPYEGQDPNGEIVKYY